MLSQQISPQELAQLLAQKHPLFLLDVRSQEENEKGNIGGHWIPLMELPQRMEEIPNNQLVVVYCRSGYRSQIALEMLIQAGIKQVKNLIGGMITWQQTYGAV